MRVCDIFLLKRMILLYIVTTIRTVRSLPLIRGSSIRFIAMNYEINKCSVKFNYHTLPKGLSFHNVIEPTRCIQSPWISKLLLLQCASIL